MSIIATAFTGVPRRAADHLSTAHRYAANPDDWPLAPRFDPVQRWYHRLAEEPGAEVWLLSWLPGQGTSLHDHGGSAGAFVVVEGTLTEGTVDARRGSAPRIVEHTLTPGAGRAFGPRHIHQIANTGVRPAISVHVYGPALREMTSYRIDGGRLLITGVDRAGADW
jgi:mannose-6-phosphate isomerase-like protein (cupin superfamily)